MHQYKCEYFKLEELFPPELMSMPPEYLWGLMDENLLVVLDRLRIAIGKPITINNWKTGGQYKWSGFRTNTCKIGAAKSAHRKGQAVDLKIKGMTPAEVLEFIISRYDEFPEIKRVENVIKTPTWLHIDTVETKQKTLYIFNP